LLFPKIINGLLQQNLQELTWPHGSRDNAVHVLQVPEEFALPAMCAMRGQAFFAETSIGQELASNERVKFMCVRHIPVGRRIT